ncbi:unnamed protein product [Vitrella brassicaformis CCMP3155]|uniref:C2 domain-containing protein n=2 Tax=Vitrella brassicaformis TaxID=1169539 RepID=A0A0G4GB90_VITBC|nr:unnamed protein product [Vitrella brassicaformis CCMP3155]|eukprot:CEM25930.1 unnamed protein product [Vitrella brassicaformis CCMP3155]
MTTRSSGSQPRPAGQKPGEKTQFVFRNSNGEKSNVEVSAGWLKGTVKETKDKEGKKLRDDTLYRRKLKTALSIAACQHKIKALEDTKKALPHDDPAAKRETESKILNEERSLRSLREGKETVSVEPDGPVPVSSAADEAFSATKRDFMGKEGKKSKGIKPRYFRMEKGKISCFKSKEPPADALRERKKVYDIKDVDPEKLKIEENTAGQKIFPPFLSDAAGKQFQYRVKVLSPQRVFKSGDRTYGYMYLYTHELQHAEAWKTAILTARHLRDLSKVDLLHRSVQKIINSAVCRGWEAIRGEYEERKEKRNMIRNVVGRLLHVPLSKGYTKWKATYAKEIAKKKQQEELQKQIMRGMVQRAREQKEKLRQTEDQVKLQVVEKIGTKFRSHKKTLVDKSQWSVVRKALPLNKIKTGHFVAVAFDCQTREQVLQTYFGEYYAAQTIKMHPDTASGDAQYSATPLRVQTCHVFASDSLRHLNIAPSHETGAANTRASFSNFVKLSSISSVVVNTRRIDAQAFIVKNQMLNEFLLELMPGGENVVACDTSEGYWLTLCGPKVRPTRANEYAVVDVHVASTADQLIDGKGDATLQLERLQEMLRRALGVPRERGDQVLQLRSDQVLLASVTRAKERSSLVRFRIYPSPGFVDKINKLCGQENGETLRDAINQAIEQDDKGGEEEHLEGGEAADQDDTPPAAAAAEKETTQKAPSLSVKGVTFAKRAVPPIQVVGGSASLAGQQPPPPPPMSLSISLTIGKASVTPDGERPSTQATSASSGATPRSGGSGALETELSVHLLNHRFLSPNHHEGDRPNYAMELTVDIPICGNTAEDLAYVDALHSVVGKEDVLFDVWQRDRVSTQAPTSLGSPGMRSIASTSASDPEAEEAGDGRRLRKRCYLTGSLPIADMLKGVETKDEKDQKGQKDTEKAQDEKTPLNIDGTKKFFRVPLRPEDSLGAWHKPTERYGFIEVEYTVKKSVMHDIAAKPMCPESVGMGPYSALYTSHSHAYLAPVDAHTKSTAKLPSAEASGEVGSYLQIDFWTLQFAKDDLGNDDRRPQLYYFEVRCGSVRVLSPWRRRITGRMLGINEPPPTQRTDASGSSSGDFGVVSANHLPFNGTRVFLPIPPHSAMYRTHPQGQPVVEVTLLKMDAPVLTEFGRGEGKATPSEPTVIGRALIDLEGMVVNMLRERVDVPFCGDDKIKQYDYSPQKLRQMYTKVELQRTVPRCMVDLCLRDRAWVQGHAPDPQERVLLPKRIFPGCQALLMMEEPMRYPQDERAYRRRFLPGTYKENDQQTYARSGQPWPAPLREPATAWEFKASGLELLGMKLEPHRIPVYCSDVIPHKFVLPASEQEFVLGKFPGVWHRILGDNANLIINKAVEQLTHLKKPLPVTVLSVYPDGTADVALPPEFLKKIQQQQQQQGGGVGGGAAQGWDDLYKQLVKRIHLSQIEPIFEAGVPIYDCSCTTAEDIMKAASQEAEEAASREAARTSGGQSSSPEVVEKCYVRPRSAPLPWDANPSVCDYEWTASIKFPTEKEMHDFARVLNIAIRQEHYSQMLKVQNYMVADETTARRRLLRHLWGDPQLMRQAGKIEVVLVEAINLKSTDQFGVRSNIKRALDVVPGQSVQKMQMKRNLDNTINSIVTFRLKLANDQTEVQSYDGLIKSPAILQTAHPKWSAIQELRSTGGFVFRTPELVPKPVPEEGQDEMPDLEIELMVWQETDPATRKLAIQYPMGSVSIPVDSLMKATEPFQNIWRPLKPIEDSVGDIHIMTRFIPSDRTQLLTAAFEAPSAKAYLSMLVETSSTLPDAFGMPVHFGQYEPNLISNRKSVFEAYISGMPPEEIDRLRKAIRREEEDLKAALAAATRRAEAQGATEKERKELEVLRAQRPSELPVPKYRFILAQKEKFLHSDAHHHCEVQRQRMAFADFTTRVVSQEMVTGRDADGQQKELPATIPPLSHQPLTDLAQLRVKWLNAGLAAKAQLEALESLYYGGFPPQVRRSLWLQLGILRSEPSTHQKEMYRKSLHEGQRTDTPDQRQLLEDITEMSGWETTGLAEHKENFRAILTKVQQICTALIAFSNGANPGYGKDDGSGNNMPFGRLPIKYSKSIALVALHMLLPHGKGQERSQLTAEEVFWLIYTMAGGNGPFHGKLATYWAKPQNPTMAPTPATPAAASTSGPLPEKPLELRVPCPNGPLAAPSGAMGDVFLLECCLAAHAEPIWTRLFSLGFSLMDFFYPAFMRLYAGILPNHSLFRLWDILFPQLTLPVHQVYPHGRKSLICLAYAVICHCGDDLVEAESATQCRECIENAFTTLHDESKLVEFVKWADSVLFARTLFDSRPVEPLYSHWIKQWGDFYIMYERQNSWLKELVQGQRPPSLHDPRTNQEKVRWQLPGIDCDYIEKHLFGHFLKADSTTAASDVLPFAAFHRPTPADLSGSFEAPGGKTAFGRFLSCVSSVAAAFQEVNKAAPAPVKLWEKSSGARGPPKGVFPTAIDFQNFAGASIPAWAPYIRQFCQLFTHTGVENKLNLQEILTALIVTCHGTASRKALQLFRVWGCRPPPDLSLAGLPSIRLKGSKLATLAIEDEEDDSEDAVSGIIPGHTPAVILRVMAKPKQQIAVTAAQRPPPRTLGEAYLSSLGKYSGGQKKDEDLLLVNPQSMSNMPPSQQFSPATYGTGEQVGRITMQVSWREGQPGSGKGRLTVHVDAIHFFSAQQTEEPYIQVYYIDRDKREKPTDAKFYLNIVQKKKQQFDKAKRERAQKKGTDMHTDAAKLDTSTVVWTFNATASAELAVDPKLASSSAAGKGATHITLQACRALTHAIMTRSLHICSNRQAICLADSTFSRFGVTPSIIEACLDDSDPPHNSVDVTADVVREWERQISRTGEIDLKFSSEKPLENTKLSDMGIRPPNWATWLRIRYSRSASGERVCVKIPVKRGVIQYDSPEPVCRFDDQERDRSLFYVDKSFFLTAMLSCPLLTESLARFSNIEQQNYNPEPVQMNVWLPSGTEVDELFGSVDPGQAVLLEVWDQDPDPDVALSLTGTRSKSPTKRLFKRTPTLLGECWLPSLSSLITLRSLNNLELKAPDDQSDNTKAIGGKTKQLPAGAQVKGTVSVRAKWEYPCTELASAGQEQRGRLHLKLLSANGLRMVDGNNSPDPFVRVWLKNETTGRFELAQGFNTDTNRYEHKPYKTIPRTCNPDWNQDNTFDIKLGAAAAIDHLEQAQADARKQAGPVGARGAAQKEIKEVSDKFWDSQIKIEFRSGGGMMAAGAAGPGRGQTSSGAAGSHGVTLLASDSVTDLILKTHLAAGELAKKEMAEKGLSKYSGISLTNTSRYCALVLIPSERLSRISPTHKDYRKVLMEEFKDEKNWEPLDPDLLLKHYRTRFQFGVPEATIHHVKIMAPTRAYSDKNPKYAKLRKRLESRSKEQGDNLWETINDDDECFAFARYYHKEDNNDEEWRPALVSIPDHQQQQQPPAAQKQTQQQQEQQPVVAAAAPAGKDASVGGVGEGGFAVRFLMDAKWPDVVPDIRPGTDVLFAHQEPSILSARRQAVFDHPLTSDFPQVISDMWEAGSTTAQIVVALNKRARESWVADAKENPRQKPPHVQATDVQQVIKSLMKEKAKATAASQET